jgi:hypothetical protein
MKTSGLKKKVAQICVSGGALAMILVNVTIAKEIKVPDVELDFHFLHLGLSRKAVVSLLGKPSAQAESETLTIKYHKLMWVGSDGTNFVAAFVQDRLWRWKTCSVSLTDC